MNTLDSLSLFSRCTPRFPSYLLAHVSVVDQPVLGVAPFAQVDAQLHVAEPDRFQDFGPGGPVPLRRKHVMEGAQGRALLSDGDELVGALEGILGLREARPSAEEAGHGVGFR